MSGRTDSVDLWGVSVTSEYVRQHGQDADRWISLGVAEGEFRLRGEAQAEQPVEYQSRLVSIETGEAKPGYDWRKCTREQYELGSTHGTIYRVEYRALYTRPQPATSDRGRDTRRREKAVEAMLADGWKWDGEQWDRPTAAPDTDRRRPCDLRAAEAVVMDATQPPAAGVDVSDEMVERALEAFVNELPNSDDEDWDRTLMRAALTAALRTGGGG